MRNQLPLKRLSALILSVAFVHAPLAAGEADAPQVFANDHLMTLEPAGRQAKVKGRKISTVEQLEQAFARLRSGDRIYIRGGHYPLSAPLRIYAKSNVLVAGFPGEQVILDWSRASENNTEIRGFTIERSGDVVLSNLELVGTSHEAISVSRDVDGLTVRGCRVHHCGSGTQNAFHLGGRNVLVENNLFYRTGSHVIYLLGSNVIFRNNIVLMSAGRKSYGIQIGAGGGSLKPTYRNIFVYNNLIGQIRNRPCIVNWGRTADVKIFNNVFYRCAQAPINLYGGEHTKEDWEIRNNVAWSSPEPFIAGWDGRTIPGVGLSGNFYIAEETLPFRRLGSSEEEWSNVESGMFAALPDLRPSEEALEWLRGKGIDPATFGEGIDFRKGMSLQPGFDLLGTPRPADRFDLGPYVAEPEESDASSRLTK